jgi:hypothetical protein
MTAVWYPDETTAVETVRTYVAWFLSKKNVVEDDMLMQNDNMGDTLRVQMLFHYELPKGTPLFTELLEPMMRHADMTKPRDWDEFAVRWTSYVVMEALSHPDCPVKYLEWALHCPNVNYQQRAWRNPECPEEAKIAYWLTRDNRYKERLARK